MRTTGRFMTLIAAFVGLTGLPPYPALAADPMQRLRDGEVLVDSQRRSGGGIVDARIFIPAPPRLVYTMVADPQQLPRISPEVVSVKVLEDQGLRKRVRMRVRQLGFIDDESEVLSLYKPYDSISWQQVKGRFAVQEGAWKITPTTGGTVLAYHLNIDVGIALPSMIVEAFLRTTVPSLLRNVKRQFDASSALPALWAALPLSPSRPLP